MLGHLDRAGALSIADLARHEEVRHQSMTRTVERRARASIIAEALRERLTPEERAVAARIPLILAELT